MYQELKRTCTAIVLAIKSLRGASLCFRSAHEADLDESFERLVDLY